MDMESYQPPRSTPVGNGAGGAIVSNAFDGWSKRGRKIVHEPDVYLQRIQYYSTTYSHYCASCSICTVHTACIPALGLIASDELRRNKSFVVLGIYDYIYL
jgi:hypothetical protein